MVLDALMDAHKDDPPWGYRLCEETGLGSGTVYPILERLEKVGWIEAHWENVQSYGRPRRRFYTIGATGRAEYGAALHARKPRRLIAAGR